METATLETPKTGKSRFSKALPAPPSFLKAMSLKGLPSSPQPFKSHTPPARKPLPTAVATSTPTNTMAKPLDSPLPPVPLSSTQPSAPLPMIPRRPLPAGSPGLPSPEDSSPLSSLLSAYTDSNRSSDSTYISSNDRSTPASSGQNSYTIDSPKQEGSAYTASSPKLDELFFAPLSIQQAEKNGSQQERSGGLQQSAESHTKKQLPLPPFKDFDLGTQSQLTTGDTYLSKGLPPACPAQVAPEAAPELSHSPISQPQIWRRRSLKAEKNLAVTELRLVSSNGSSASTSSIHAPEPPPKEASSTTQLQPPNPDSVLGSAAPTRSPLPVNPNAAFPGRNIRPVASRQNLDDEGSDNMGQELSRVKNSLKKADKGQNPGVARKESIPQLQRNGSPVNRNPSPPTNASISSPARLPTPEYDTGDFKSPMVETIVSPVSPASSPELPSEPRQRQLAPESQDFGPVKSTPSLPAGQDSSSQNRSNTLTAKPSLQGLSERSLSGLPSSPAASRNGAAPPRSQFPARTTSKAARSPVMSLPNPETDSQSVAVSTPLQKIRTVSEAGSMETVRPQRQDQFSQAPETQPAKVEVREDDTTSDPGAERFPRGWAAKIPDGTVFRPVPISEKHHRCLTRHQIMHQCRNTYYPLACQACGLQDSSWRFTCSSCNLRVCKSCRMKMRKVNGDLHALMEHIDTVLVESSTELEFDHEEAALQTGKVTAASATQRRASPQTAGRP